MLAILLLAVVPAGVGVIDARPMPAPALVAEVSKALGGMDELRLPLPFRVGQDQAGENLGDRQAMGGGEQGDLFHEIDR